MTTNNTTYDRYQRQILLKGFGEEGQQKLTAASVLVIGAGGLGCPALQYLVAAGIGKVGIVDDLAVGQGKHIGTICRCGVTPAKRWFNSH